MESSKPTISPTLHSAKFLPNVLFNRILATLYIFAILILFYHHAQTLLFNSTNNPSTFFGILIISFADLFLAFMWCGITASRLYPIRRQEFPENLEKAVKRSDFPAIDVFICTADPTKEPPLSVVNTALSVMAYDYPPEKLSVYISDDGGSAVTLFAFMEAAKFAAHWLPFCRDNNVVDRSPEAYFESTCASMDDGIKIIYERMKARVERVVERGKVDDEYMTSDEEKQVFKQWNSNFTRQNHPTVIQILLENDKNKDMSGCLLPTLIYVSREKSKATHHHFKAGALNALVRVSAVMTNAPIVLTLDCDMCSNDPQTLIRVLCYYSDAKTLSTHAFIQFPQHFMGLNKNDIYDSQFKRSFQLNPMGFDGLRGSKYVGTGCFFSRRALFGGPSNFIPPEIPELSPRHAVRRPISSQQALALAYNVANCNYENKTSWGDNLGFRYGSLVEDIFTGYRLHCEGWKSIFCNPRRAAFIGNAPTNLLDLLNQLKRWAVGVFEIGFSSYSPIIYGRKYLGPLLTLLYCWYSFWPIWSIPITIYSFLPQLALLNNVSLFPEVSELWFLLYLFLFVGAYVQDCYELVSEKGTFKMWWNDQRFWIIRGLTCLLFGSLEFLLKTLGVSTQGFNVTSKVVDNEQSKRYQQGLFEFGNWSPMFVTLSTAALINLVSFNWGLAQLAFGGNNLEGLVIQMMIAGFGMVNSWPIYEAMFLRRDNGKMPAKVIIFSVFFTFGLYLASSFIF